MRPSDGSKRARLVIVVVVGGLIVATVVAVRGVAERRVSDRVNRATVGIERVLHERGSELAAGYPLNAERIGDAFAGIDGATFVAALELDNGLRLAFEAKSMTAVRCLRYDIAGNGSFTHDVVNGGC